MAVIGAGEAGKQRQQQWRQQRQKEQFKTNLGKEGFIKVEGPRGSRVLGRAAPWGRAAMDLKRGWEAAARIPLWGRGGRVSTSHVSSLTRLDKDTGLDIQGTVFVPTLIEQQKADPVEFVVVGGKRSIEGGPRIITKESGLQRKSWRSTVYALRSGRRIFGSKEKAKDLLVKEAIQLLPETEGVHGRDKNCDTPKYRCSNRPKVTPSLRTYFRVLPKSQVDVFDSNGQGGSREPRVGADLRSGLVDRAEVAEMAGRASGRDP
ncbi:hypothetical protein NDU88_005098 [Pleurodeles waltl]|uniref:Uncharacterized protein n=1 Tax=Pleurodeles waltl TaxID=8319 RepID=A0AAV7QDW4_PLEWA|nr:hypothetical protein NDU88_005098 [Pleurodeles waltl]